MQYKYSIIYVLHTVFLIIAGNESYCQNETDNWYFGNKAALNFSNCNPAVVNGSQINTIEGCATISDANGNLLFYTEGINVWSKNNVLMQNGTGLYGHPSSTQSGVIIPQPGNDSIYYIFTIDYEYGSNGLCYSLVNINHNGGLGEVMVKNVNVLTSGITSANEKITAVRHFNKRDVWVITRQFYSNKYYAWLITANGVSATPVISTTPNYIGSPINTSRGYLKPSSDGKKLVAAYNVYSFLEMSDFNSQTGDVTNTIKIDSRPSIINRAGIASPYGVEFSPNNKLLYISTRFDFTQSCPTCLDVNYYIFQYNVNVFDSTTIANSVVLIDSGGTVAHPNYDIYGALQLTKTGKIYIAQAYQNKLSSINNPNVAGTACNFQKDAIDLGFGQSIGGLPTFIQSYFDPNYRNYDYTYSEDCNKTLSFTLNTSFAYDSLRWDFNDPASGLNNTSILPNPTHTYNSNSVRMVKLLVYNHYGCISRTDTVQKQITIGNKYFNLGNDTVICERDTLLLNASTNGANSYSWNTGATTPTIKVYQPGIYWCDVSFGGCVYRDSLVLTNKPYPIVNLGNSITLCEGQTKLLDATNPNSTYLWQDASTNATYLVTQKGQYKVRVTMIGCITRDTINVDYNLKPNFTLGTDRLICTGAKITLDPQMTGVSYLWQDGSLNRTYLVTQPGLYFLTATNICGSKTDSVVITKGVCKLYIPNAFSPNGDGVNDVFKTGFGENVTEFHLQIFNRYGQLIFETRNQSKGWDGNFKRVRQPNGSYIWLIQYKTTTDRNLQKMQGVVILLR